MTSKTTARVATTLATAALAIGGSLAAALPGTAHASGTVAAASTAGQVAPSDGWSAVILGTPGEGGNGTLYLVSPTGKQVRVLAGLPWAATVSSVSGDGKHILYTDTVGTGRTRVVDVATGRASTISASIVEARFTKPSGTALLGRRSGQVPGALVRTDLSGGHMVTMAGTEGGGMYVPGLDGTVIASQDRNNRIILNDNRSGAVVRRYANPAGYWSCEPRHFSDETHFTAACISTGDNPREQVYRFSTGGGAPVAVTAKVSVAGYAQWGFGDSWATPSGQVVSVSPSCGSPRLALVKGNRPVAFTGPVDGSSPLGVVGDSAWYVGPGECDSQTATITRHDIGTNHDTLLAGGKRNPGLVVRSVAFADAKQ